MLMNITPLVCYFDDFLTPEECNHIITLAESKIEPSLVCAPTTEDNKDTRESITSPNRTSSHTFIDPMNDTIVFGVCNKIARFANLHPGTAEPLQVVRYEEGQEYQPHWDGWDFNTEKNWLGHAGQRIMTALIYLNEVEEGGYTIFPELNIEVDPRPGRVVFFQNVWPGNPNRHPQSLHGGAPVIKGTKWACNLWFRERMWNAQ